MKRKEIGILGEKLAKNFLKKEGYRIRETNFRCREGEIDIIAEIEDCLVFVEVRTKTSYSFGTPEESLVFDKKEKLVRSALKYLDTHQNLPSCWRIDFVAVELDQEGTVIRMELIKNILN